MRAFPDDVKLREISKLAMDELEKCDPLISKLLAHAFLVDVTLDHQSAVAFSEYLDTINHKVANFVALDLISEGGDGSAVVALVPGESRQDRILRLLEEIGAGDERPEYLGLSLEDKKIADQRKAERGPRKILDERVGNIEKNMIPYIKFLRR